MKVAQLCLTLCDPMDYTVRGILQARTLEWVEGGSNRPRVTAGGRRDSGDGTLHGCQAGLSQGGSGNTVGDRASRTGGCLASMEKAEHRGNPGLEGLGRG